jgi:nucleoside-diphosphate-sugar epimerase
MLKIETILLTGGTGFLGQIIKNKLSTSGYKIKTVGRSAGNDIQCDLAKSLPVLAGPFDIVIHNAGKAHMVPKNAKQKQEFFDNNCQATRNLLTGVENSGVLPKAIVFISSIAVYGLVEGQNVGEDHPLTAQDPYGKSKIEAEQLVLAWCARHAVGAGILRLPLLAGKNPPGNLGSMINAIVKGYYLNIAGGTARKSVVLAEDVAEIVPMVASMGGIYNLTDGYHPSFAELENLIVKQTRSKKPFNISLRAARMLGMFGDVLDAIVPEKAPITSRKVKKIVSTLTFDDKKARHELAWNPRKVIDELVV